LGSVPHGADGPLINARQRNAGLGLTGASFDGTVWFGGGAASVGVTVTFAISLRLSEIWSQELKVLARIVGHQNQGVPQ
jgi:hypothetical protein